MKLETLKGRSDRPTTSRRLTEAMLVKAVEQIADQEQIEEEDVFNNLMKAAGALPAEEEEPANEGVALTPDEELKEILEGNVEEVEEAIMEMDTPNLNRLASLEKEDKNRKGVLEAIDAMLEE